MIVIFYINLELCKNDVFAKEHSITSIHIKSGQNCKKFIKIAFENSEIRTREAQFLSLCISNKSNIFLHGVI